MYGFLDEAGDVGSGPHSSATFIVAVVVTGDPNRLRREVKKARFRLGKKKHQLPEFKASQSSPTWNRKRLERLAQLDIAVIVVVAEKKVPLRSPDPEALYRELCIRALEECLHRYPTLSVRVDKRYTKLAARTAYDHALRHALEQPGRILMIEHADSTYDPALQQADLVAWAFWQKYTHKDDSFVSFIREKVVMEILESVG